MWGEIEYTNLLGVLNLPWQGFGGETFTKIEKHAGMADRLVRDLAIKEAIQTKIKATLAHKIK